MATSRTRRRRRRTAGTGAPAEGRAMTLAKQAGVVVGLISGIAGLVFLFFPGLRPQLSEPSPDQSATISRVVSNPRATREQFLDYSDRSKEGYTRAQLAVVGASAFARVQIVGYRGKRLTLQSQVVDARTGDVVGRTRDFMVTPPAERVTHPWWDWVPLRRGRGNYVLVMKVLDERAQTAIACGQSSPFGGLAGLVAARRIQICEPA